MKRSTTLIFLSGLFLSSCCGSQEPKNNNKNVNPNLGEFALIGKKGITTFPKMKVETSYLTDSTMHWKTTNSKGEIAEGDEKVSYEKLADNLHFLNWVEQNGYVISLIINTKDGKVKAYWSYADENARGKRSSTFTDGKFEFAK